MGVLGWAVALCVHAKRADTESESIQCQEKRAIARESRRASDLLAQARELHSLAPSRETRLLVVLGEAYRDLAAAVQVEDWDTAKAFKFQVETIEALLTIPTPEPVVQPMEPWHRDLVRAATWN
jgi:hypothetical protein